MLPDVAAPFPRQAVLPTSKDGAPLRIDNRPVSDQQLSRQHGIDALLSVGTPSCHVVVLLRRQGIVLDPVSSSGALLRDLLLIVTIIGGIVLAIVEGAVAFILFKYRSARGDADGAQAFGSKRLELAWSAIPMIVVAVLFGLSLRAARLVDPPTARRDPDIVEISTIGGFMFAAAVLVFLFNVDRSIRRGAPARSNPWNAWTLEWATARRQRRRRTSIGCQPCAAAGRSGTSCTPRTPTGAVAPRRVESIARHE